MPHVLQLCLCCWGSLPHTGAPQSPLSGVSPLLPTSTAELTLLWGLSPRHSRPFSQNTGNLKILFGSKSINAVFSSSMSKIC